ncbi:MAG: RHS repeat protein, partial [Verrucomicrobia bacterium]|nr:RHS repeat protein [Verrucomicrobiota bacterium]
LQHTDPRGFTAHYSYNENGQLLQMRKEDQLTEYTYDPRGRKIAELSWSDPQHYLLKRLEYDLLDRITAEQLEDETGKAYQRNETIYDLAGNVIRTSTLLSSTTTDYDSFNRPIQQVDALGQVTTISYGEVPFEGQTVRLTTTTDPLGRQTLTYKDEQGHLLHEEQRDAQNHLLSQVDYFYDLNGNEVKQEHQVLSEGQMLRTYAFSNTYGPGNLLIQSTEGLNCELPRITRYFYDSASRLNGTIKPDGAHLYRTYDVLGRLASHEGPDFSYTYTYDAADNLIAVNDVSRSYDAHNRLLSETTPSGTIRYKRDRLGRRTHLSYLGQEVSYTYRGPYLATVSSSRLTHRYLEYDLEGRPIL